MSLYSVLDDVLDSQNFTVGGGSASAIAGAMAAGLVGMVARLSLGKDYGLEDARYEALARELDTLSRDLQAGAEEDTKAFLGIKAAFALPKETDQDKAARKIAIEDAAVNAARIPKENAEKAKRVLEIHALLEGKSNPNAGSDMTGGFLLAKSALTGCALNIEANLPLIKDPAKKEPLEKAFQELMKFSK